MTEQKDDIIDFSLLIQRVSYPYTLLKKHLRLSLVYIAAALIVAIILKFTLSPVYSGSFIIKANETKDNFFLNMLIDIETLVKDQDAEGISKELKISEEQADAIKKVTIIPLLKPQGIDSSSSVIIVFEMSQREHFITIQNALISYLENNPHYKKLKEIRLSNIDSLQQKLSLDLKEMDSVKTIIINNIKPPVASGNGMIYNVPIDPYKAYDENIARYREQIILLNKKKIANSFDLVKPCVVSKKPVWPKLSTLALILLPIALVLFLLHAHRKETKTNPF